MCEDVESVRWRGGGGVEGGRSTAVQRDKKLWDCRVERKKRKKAEKTDGYRDSLCVCVCERERERDRKCECTTTSVQWYQYWRSHFRLEHFKIQVVLMVLFKK